MIILLIWIVVLVAAVFVYLRQMNSRFRKYGVKHVTSLSFLGNMGRMLLRTTHFTDIVINLYKKYPGERFIGSLEFVTEQLMILDLDLVKQITVKDYEYFLDHRSLLSESNSFFARNLFSLQGQEWKEMRSTLSPAFTSSKIRGMVPFMIEAGDQITMMLKEKLKNSDKDYIEVDCKELTARHANDVIASCAFGLKVNSHKDVNNQFYERGMEATNVSFGKIMVMLLMMNAPKVAKLLKWDVLSEKTKQFFCNLVLVTMRERELKNIMRPDMIHLLMEAKKGRLTHEHVKSKDLDTGFATVEESSVGTKQVDRVWSDNDLIAQALIFFIAGFETVSTGMSFLLYELAVNSDVQSRLANEIREQYDRNGNFDYNNSILSMKYLDMVVSELLRLWPAPVLDRECTKDYNIGKPNKNAEKDFIVRKGTVIGIPTIAFHRDPKYFPNPEKFDPERFSDKNKHKIHPFVYMPFGVGPRNCIGSRFALCEIKALTCQILLNWEILPTSTTCIPAKLATDSFNFRLQGGHALRFRLRA